MKIVHLCLSCFYIDNYGYQENLLPKYNKIDGHDVTVIASTFTYNEESGEPDITEPREYINSDGIKIIRIAYKHRWLGKLNEKLKIFQGTYEILEREKPDLIFNHGMQFLDITEVARYIRNHPNCKLVVDNHAASINSGTSFLSREILHKKIYKRAIRKALPTICKIFMIAPGCKKFAENMYGLSNDKMEYLYLGADTYNIDFKNQIHIREKIRGELNIKNDDFVLITGGKLNKEKNISLLLDAFRNIKSTNMKLIIFGVFPVDLKPEMLRQIELDQRVIYIGWLEGKDVYNYYLASDVAVFPGSKSALWEQAICSGLPLICRKWEGMEYVDVGGNCIFIENDESQLIDSIQLLLTDSSLYKKMKKVAETEGMETFSYEKISRQAINC